MQIFDRDSKYNFVDDNNVFVGFDSYGQCCEDFGYSLRLSEPTNESEAKEDNWFLPTDNFQFDTDYFNSEGDWVTFRLVDAKDGIFIFLTLYNFHNGYYSHGFSAKVAGIQWQNGSI